MKNPDVTLVKVPKTKKDPSVIDSIVATLTGKTSERFTKIATRYARAKRIEKMLSKERVLLNAQVKEMGDELFTKRHHIYTRVVDTATMIFKFSKAGESTCTTFDKDAYILQLEKASKKTEKQLAAMRKKLETTSTSKVDSKLLTPKEKALV